MTYLAHLFTQCVENFEFGDKSPAVKQVSHTHSIFIAVVKIVGIVRMFPALVIHPGCVQEVICDSNHVGSKRYLEWTIVSMGVVVRCILVCFYLCSYVSESSP